MSVSHYAIRAFALLWGLVALAVTTLRSYANRKSSSGSEQYRLLRDAQHRIWSLEDEAMPGLHHNFLTLSSGLQLHYVTTGGQQTATRSLVIFLHGFPDSWYIYKRFLESTALKATGAQLVAIDLPGCGGSDDLRQYGPDEMLNAVGEAVAQLKARYLTGGDRRSSCDWLQRIRLYREGLASDKWNLAPILQQYRPAPDMDEETFKCPVTAVFGLQDVAINPRLALDGIERYFPRSAQVTTGGGGHEKHVTSTASGAGASHIVRLKDCGHWSLLEEPVGSGVVEKILLWLLSQQSGTVSKGSLEHALTSDELAQHVTIETYQ
ncbi:hypothetical protein LTR48_001243 [Friedmanniomyces endolithicus]|uniref:AB hydrolase-1 domain-containing protein n=1 Tax=Rachicladosporium monterosium TaxID=1507873 RepID=A0ABR0LE91_9PEZI|nr:hypothetical protein LTR48_001243 [Friedmanniomyces endolithicus]KAK5147451.1 hypothetical protein LTR32_001108 [Rachicladosporium monterosium]